MREKRERESDTEENTAKDKKNRESGRVTPEAGLRGALANQEH